MSIYDIKKNKITVGRAGTGIYLILKAHRPLIHRVLVPANLCYAAIYPIIYAGAMPVFCDVEPKTGNINEDIVRNHISEVDAVIAPHMYGNPICDIVEIAKLCKKSGAILIEDCASAMGATVNGVLCGSFGDYCLFSFGYSKTIDFGGGGVVLSDNNLDNLRAEYDKLPDFSGQVEDNDSFFSKLYRLIRNDGKQNISEFIWSGLLDNMKSVYLYKDHRFDEAIESIDERLASVVLERKKKCELYAKLVDSKDMVYDFSTESVPWRFCMIISHKYRRNLIEYLLSEGLPVSDWYPVVTPIFGEDDDKYPVAKLLGEEMLNFPLLIDEKEIERICICINNWFKEKNRNENIRCNSNVWL